MTEALLPSMQTHFPPYPPNFCPSLNLRKGGFQESSRHQEGASFYFSSLLMPRINTTFFQDGKAPPHTQTHFPEEAPKS